MGKQPHACARLVLGAAVAAACVCTRASAQIAPSVNYLPNVLLDRWPAMPLVERLDFILSKRERQAYLKEFRKLDKDGDGLLSRAEITRRAKASGINEFDGDTRVSDMVDKFMKEGDGKRRSTQGGGNDDGQLDFEEFLVARGWFDSYLTPYEGSEWDERESSYVMSLEERVRSAPPEVLGYTVDANGMIVDDKQARAAKARLAELDDAADGGATRRIGDIPYPVWWCRDNIAPLGDPSCMRHNPDEW